MTSIVSSFITQWYHYDTPTPNILHIIEYFIFMLHFNPCTSYHWYFWSHSIVSIILYSLYSADFISSYFPYLWHLVLPAKVWFPWHSAFHVLPCLNSLPSLCFFLPAIASLRKKRFICLISFSWIWNCRLRLIVFKCRLATITHCFVYNKILGSPQNLLLDSPRVALYMKSITVLFNDG